MSLLPSDVFRFIQQEETTEKASFSEFLLQGVGGDLNYLKKEFDIVQAQIDSFLNNGGVRTTNIFIAAGFTTAVTPNSKDWFAAFIVPVQTANIQTVIQPVIPNYTTKFNGAALYTATIGGNTLTTLGGWAHEWQGYGLYRA